VETGLWHLARPRSIMMEISLIIVIVGFGFKSAAVMAVSQIENN